MNADAKRFSRIQTEIEETRSEIANAEGQLVVFKDKLREITGSDSIKKAAAFLESLKTNLKKKEQRFEKSLQQLEEAWDGS